MQITIYSDSIPAQAETTVIPLAIGPRMEQCLQSFSQEFGIDTRLLHLNFKGETGEVLPLLRENQQLFLLGLGADPSFSDLVKAFRTFTHQYRHKMEDRLAVNFIQQDLQQDQLPWVEAAVNGIVLGTYQSGRFKTSDFSTHPFASKAAELQIFVGEALESQAVKAAEQGRIVGETQLSIYDLVNAPSNKKTPEVLASWAVASGRQYGYQVTVLDKEAIQRQGFHALLAVNQGSPTPPALLIMEYLPEDGKDGDYPKVGLVGKGVTFDTGGLSIKPSNNMHLMKSDMGGAGAVLGTMEAAARLQLPVHLIGVVPATDNSVDANAIKPSDVINSYSGKTIEIIDTDAEGRLILADGLAYVVQNHRPEVLIDLATLTGSTVRALGYQAAGLFSNDDDLAENLFRIGYSCGERVWRLPLWDVYKEDLKSDVADLRNLGGKPIAGAIWAAKFLETFTFEHPHWAHLDIAGVAFTDSEFSSQRSATAFGVRLLTDYLKELKK